MQPVNPEELSPPVGYSHGMLAPSGGRLLFIAGQIAWDEDEQIVGDDFPAQMHQALANVVAVVEAAGGRPEHIGQLTFYVTDKQEYQQSLRATGVAYRAVMGRHFPAMALVEVKSLLDPAARVEVQGIAVVPAPVEEDSLLLAAAAEIPEGVPEDIDIPGFNLEQ